METTGTMGAALSIRSGGAPSGRLRRFLAHGALAVLAAAVTFAMMRAQFAAVWHSGVFFDTDDTMHVVQTRALLGGQNWFDMTVARMDPPQGTFMHWSRIADLPFAGLIRLFGLAFDPVATERLSRLAYPFLGLVALYLAMMRLATALLGPDARVPVLAATLLSGTGVVQFLPGRIDHHAPQIVILVAMLVASVEALEPRRARIAALVGPLAGLSLAINLENLPLMLALFGGFVTLWVIRGDALRRALGWFAGGLLIGLPAFFAVSVAPVRYLAPTCDAFGAAHLGAGLIGAAGIACAALAGTRLPNAAARAGAATLAALAVATFVALVYPACLGNPFAAVDPLVRDLWLSHVEESLPLATLLRRSPATALFEAAPVALGLVACFAAAVSAPLRRQGFVLVALVVAAGFVTAFWQVRVLSSVAAIASCGGVHVVLAAQRFWRARGREAFASLALLLLLPFTATAVALALPAEASTPEAGTTKAGTTEAGTTEAGASAARPTAAACLSPEAFAPMKGLRGAVLAPVDAGSYFLVHTDLAVYAAAFHRDNDGNRFYFDAMLAPAAEAARMALKRKAAFVALCDGLPETRMLAARAPGGLAADLVAGRPPAWLVPVPLAGTPYRLFAVTAPP